MNTNENTEATLVRSVQRAAQIIKCFKMEDSELLLGEISQRVGLPKSTTHRILYTLETEGLIYQNTETGKYGLGYECLTLGNNVSEHMDFRKIATAEMQKLVDATGQTSNLYILRGFQRVCIEQIPGHHYVRRLSYLGAIHPLYIGATGKLFMADMPPERLDAYLNSIKKQDISINEADLRDELARIRMNGYSRSIRERNPYTASVAAPIRDSSGQAVAGITISGSASEFDEAAISQFIKLVKGAARQISNSIKDMVIVD